MAMTPATPQQTEDFIFGSGMNYPWWRRFVPDFLRDEVTCDAPDDWAFEVVARDPEYDDDDRTVIVTVDHDRIMVAALAIYTDPEYRKSLRDQCWLLRSNPDEADVDSVDADAILQVAVFGKVIYG